MNERPNKSSYAVVIVADHATVNGGQAKVAIESAISLKKAGHRSIYFSAASQVDSRLTEAGVEVIHLGQTDLLGNPSKAAAAIQGIWNQRAFDALSSLLSNLSPNDTVVHVHGWAKAISASIAVAIRHSKLPAVLTVHEYFLFCANGGFYNYRTHQPCTLRPQSQKCWLTNCDSRNYADKLWRCSRTAIMRNMLRLPDVFSDIVLISTFQKDIIQAHLPKKARLHLISNPIDAVDFGPKADPASGHFIYVGRLSKEKGPLLFAEAARKANIVPYFVGAGPMDNELQVRYPEAQLLGWQEPAQVRHLIRMARVLVFPSLWYEGQPLTVLEAMSLGTPVIVSDGCAARDVVENAVSGIWFTRNDISSLASALQQAKNDKLVKEMSLTAYRRFWSNPPTIDCHLRNIEQLYEQMLRK